jgi:CheY-like chemotaxis protein
MMPSSGIPRRRPSGTRNRGAHVLVVDDDALVLDSLRRVLSDEFEVTTTIRPEEAIEWILAGASYDVILCDVMMPVLNGVDFRDPR